MRFRSNLVFRLDSTVVSWRSLEEHGGTVRVPSLAHAPHYLAWCLGQVSGIKLISATDQLWDLDKIIHCVPQFLHLSNGVANIKPTLWGSGVDTEAEDQRLHYYDWRAPGISNICQHFHSSCPYLVDEKLRHRARK